ncbi:DBP-1 [Mocis latipes granulovirus]|uniref:DBP-1 n=1 Tax=Mocis latipes granulovirus TaxID=2072024 RepID=A0A161C752_9BBAC|nr:DBP-1 [Mocis latipes granulovirus]AKR17512.1 DBP-1 [Mocis latipes granulovirus]
MLSLVNNENKEVANNNDVTFGIQHTVIERMHDARNRMMVLQTNTNHMMQLKKRLSFMQNKLPIQKLNEQITHDENGKMVSKTISLQKRQGLMCTYYNVGMRVEGGLINFYVVDRCQVRLCESIHGDFLTFEGDSYPLYINTYQTIMASTLLKPYLMITKTKLMTIGFKTDKAKRLAMLQKFYVATVDNNEEIYSKGELGEDQMLTVVPMTEEKFNSLFVMAPMKKSTDPVEFVVAAVINGVNKGISRDDMLMMDGSSDSNTSVYTLNIEPEIFIYFEKK